MKIIGAACIAAMVGLAGVSITGVPLRINEIMPAPLPGQPEWVELVNCAPDTVDLARWSIGNRRSRYVITTGSCRLPPGALVVLTKDSAQLTAVYHGIPGLLVQAHTLPTYLWTNTGDAVVVCDPGGAATDSLWYNESWLTKPGTSLERIDAAAPSADPANWAMCEDTARGTPGSNNSVMRLATDLCALSAFASPGRPDTVLVSVGNAGRQAVTGFTVALFDDMNGDSSAAPSERVAGVFIDGPLAPGASMIVPVAWAPSPGTHTVIAWIELSGDQRMANNRAFCTVSRAFMPGSLVINEIMAEPLAGGSEYVEIANTLNIDVNLRGWMVTDQAGAKGKMPLSPHASTLHPGEFMVLGMDTALFHAFPTLNSVDRRLITIPSGTHFTLNNDYDEVVLFDPSGAAIDSVAYRSSWHNPDLADHAGRSLERISATVPGIDSRNWGTSTDGSGGTPCRRNSMSVVSPGSLSRLSFYPNPFSPDADGIDDVVLIHYDVPSRTSMINLRIFDVCGRLIRRLANNEPGGPAGDVVWDGRDDSGTVARIGVYVVLLEAVDSGLGVVLMAKGAVVLGARL